VDHLSKIGIIDATALDKGFTIRDPRTSIAIDASATAVIDVTASRGASETSPPPR